MSSTKLYPRVSYEGGDLVVRLEARPENAGEMCYGYFFAFDPMDPAIDGKFLGRHHRAHMRRVARAHIWGRVRHGRTIH